MAAMEVTSVVDRDFFATASEARKAVDRSLTRVAQESGALSKLFMIQRLWAGRADSYWSIEQVSRQRVVDTLCCDAL